MEVLKTCAAAVLALSALAATATVASAQPVPVLNAYAPGSFLVFPKFDIRGTTETEFKIVNTGSASVDAKLVFVCPGISRVNAFCSAMDMQLSFTPKQTRVVDIGDVNPPCNQGYAVAYAVTPAVTPPGVPAGASAAISWNYLLGSYNIEQGRRQEADIAMALQSPATKGTTLSAFRFGTDYSSLPKTLYADFHAIEPAENEGSRMVLLTLDALAGMQNATAVAAVDFWNAAEVPHSSSLEFVCWTELALDEIDANFLRDNLGSEVGSLRIQALPSCPIPGACGLFATNNPAFLGAVQQFEAGTLSIRNMNHDLTPKTTTFVPR